MKRYSLPDCKVGDWMIIDPSFKNDRVWAYRIAKRIGIRVATSTVGNGLRIERTQ